MVRQAGLGWGVVVLALSTLTGCYAPTRPGEENQQAPGDQMYPYHEVLERSKELREGMTKFDVRIMLGTPAERNGNFWYYHNTRTGLFVPTTRLRLEFQRGVLQEWKQVPVVFGESWGRGPHPADQREALLAGAADTTNPKASE